MEVELNARGIPAARVRRLGEFLDEVEDGSKLSFQVSRYPHEGGVARTAGLGFLFQDPPDLPNTGAPRIGQDTLALMRGIGISDAQIQALAEAGVVKTMPQGDR
jgi:crotonobetainyl-CoA:carnitine CoA-transferase CaiB-like acyl-CoA transferase